jgi:hypothetical protein
MIPSDNPTPVDVQAVLDVVLELLSDLVGCPLSPGDCRVSLEDLGLASFDRVFVQSHIVSQYGVLLEDVYSPSYDTALAIATAVVVQRLRGVTPQ